jgi:Family of unknown function (DUF6252)
VQINKSIKQHLLQGNKFFMKKSLFGLLAMLLLSLCACNKSESLSSDTGIVSVEAISTAGEKFPYSVMTNGSVVLRPLCPTNEHSIKVTVKVADKATCSLASGTELNLRSTQEFTVTAEDGTTKNWAIFVQGAALYSTKYYTCGSCEKVVDCAYSNDITTASNYSESNGNITIRTYTPIGGKNYFTGFIIDNKSVNSGLVGSYNISFPNDNTATFNSETSFLEFGYIAAPSGTLTIHSVDLTRKLISGSFDFTQVSFNSPDTRDRIKGQFYSIGVK